jgi:hypothetical protein
MRTALLSLITAAALASPAAAQQPATHNGIYPSLTTLPRVRNGSFPGSYPVVPPRNTPLAPGVADFPFLANGRVYTMGQMYQTYGFAPYSAPMTYGYDGNSYGGYSGGYYSYGWRW